jgi:hypothetical protein
MSRPKIGSVVEFETNRGLAYALYTHRKEKWGDLLRVFEGFYAERPADLSQAVRSQVRFSMFMPLGPSAKRGLVKIAGEVPIPADLQKFPTFRGGNYSPSTKTVGQWWLWDGERSWMVPGLTPEEWKYPIRGIANPAFIVGKLEMDWREAGALF